MDLARGLQYSPGTFWGLYERLLQIQPNRLDIWKAAGALYLFDLDDKDNALRAFRRALTLEIDPAERGRLEAMIKELGG